MSDHPTTDSIRTAYVQAAAARFDDWLADIWDAGYDGRRLEDERQRRDPSYPLCRPNPYRHDAAPTSQPIEDSSGDLACEWADYRKNFAGTDLAAEHRAFKAGWQARGGEADMEGGPLR